MTDLVSQLVAQLEDMRGKVIELCQTYGNALPHGSLERTEAALTAAKAGGWVAVASEPMPRDDGSYLVANAVRGMVAPHIRGVIYNNPGTNWDWQYGEAVTHWQPLPTPPKEQS